MWKTVESSVCPETVDNSSSEFYVYVRKDIKETEREGQTIYIYKEQKIKKEDWELYKQTFSNTTDLEDVRAALIELAEIVMV